MYGPRFKNVIEQAKVAIDGLSRRAKVYKNNDHEFDPLIHSFLFRHRRYLFHVLTKGTQALLRRRPEGPNVHRWRSATLQTPEISRVCIDLLTIQNTVTVSQIESVSGASRESVRKCLNHAVELGLLYRHKNRRKKPEEFTLTKLMTEELADRHTAKFLDDDVVNLARAITIIDDVRGMAKKSRKFEKINPAGMDTWPTLQEDLTEFGIDDDGNYINKC
tara:strand:+ start:7531 stop:8187 length:657 start_codon:yes stop_codon:yes gene_type:complete